MDRFLVYVQILIKNEHIVQICSLNGQVITQSPRLDHRS